MLTAMFYHLLPHCLETGCLIEPIDRLVASNSQYLYPYNTGVTSVHMARYIFYMGVRDLKSGPHVDTASTLTH